MPQLRLALAQIDVTVGDLDGNADRIVEWSRKAAEAGAHLVAFPEMALTGYPPEDLVLRGSFAKASQAALHRLAARLADRRPRRHGRRRRLPRHRRQARPARRTPGGRAGERLRVPATAARIIARYAKHHLPNYGVFDEFRYFVPGDAFPVLRFHGVDIAMCVCEDLWQDGGPVAVAARAEVGLVVCINGSPYERLKSYTRDELAARRAVEAGAVLAYVNMVGGQDELVFDGDSLIVDADGELCARAPQFEETLLVSDLDFPAAGGTFSGPVDASDGTRMHVERIDRRGRGARALRARAADHQRAARSGRGAVHRARAGDA